MIERIPLFFIGLLLLGACGEDDAVTDKPAPPGDLTVNTGTKELTWSLVSGAKSYNVYVKTVAQDLASVDFTQLVVDKSDTKITSTTSPFSFSAYNKCHTAYFLAVSSVGSSGESDISRPLGFGPPVDGCTP